MSLDFNIMLVSSCLCQLANKTVQRIQTKKKTELTIVSQ